MQYLETTITNPFGAPVFHIAETETTMKDARKLAAEGRPDGTVVFADYQRCGRGRIEGRKWKSIPGENLLCTTFFRREPVPGFTLRIGLAIALTFDIFLGHNEKTQIKWPNDVLFEGKKLAGILCENDGAVLYVGTGLNISQTDFPEELNEKATSLARIFNISRGKILDTDEAMSIPSIETVLSLYLKNLKSVLELSDWQQPISKKLWRRGERLQFLAGDPNKKELLDGYIEGIGCSGELQFRSASGGSVQQLFSGEFPY